MAVFNTEIKRVIQYFSSCWFLSKIYCYDIKLPYIMALKTKVSWSRGKKSAYSFAICIAMT